MLTAKHFSLMVLLHSQSERGGEREKYGLLSTRPHQSNQHPGTAYLVLPESFLMRDNDSWGQDDSGKDGRGGWFQVCLNSIADGFLINLI